jgi:branched-chain amino acid transport system substrate-binding protein
MPALLRLRAAAVSALVLAGCSAGDRAEPAEPVACPGGLTVPAARPSRTLPAPGPVDEPVRPGGDGLDIVALLPGTGDLGFLGAATTAAVEVAVEDVNAAGGVLGRPVRLAHVDSAEGTAGAAEAALSEHLAAGADAVVGPLSSSVAAAVLPGVAASGAVLVTPGATASALDTVDGPGRLFRTVAAEAVQGRALAELVLEDGAREVGLVVRADDHGRAVADAFTDAFTAGGGRISQRIDRDPSDEVVDLGSVATRRPDAAVLVGLADTAPVIDALVAAGQGPRERLTYGTDGNLGDRLGDLVAHRRELACLRGLLAAAPVPGDLARRLEQRLGKAALGADLSHAAEAYDAVLAVAVAAEAAGTVDAPEVAAALLAVTTGGRPCGRPDRCLQLVRSGTDVALVGASGPLRLDESGNRTAATLTFAAFGPSGRLAPLGARSSG